MKLLPAAVIIAVLTCSTATANAARKHNVIVVFTDDHGYADLGCQGIRKDLKTPHIDSLAKGGVRMTSGYVTAPQCVPSRAGLLSGRYQNRFGVESNRQSVAPFGRESTIAERLKAAGYATGMVGKWHLGRAGEIIKHGFDDVYYQDGRWTNYNFAGKTVKPGTAGPRMYHLDGNNKAAVAFIERHHRKPFFLYVAHRAPHVPLSAPQKYLDRFPGKMPRRRKLALAMIAAMDDGVGEILASLRKHRIEDNTLIFVIGDNGAPLKIHKYDAPGGGPGWDGSLNDPLNGEKGMLSEGGIRVPFLAYWKGTLPAGKVYDHPVISLDVAATATAIAGQKRDPKLDGVNLLPYLRGEKKSAPHETLYWRWIAQAAVREGKWKYLRGGTRKYLFNLDKDPGEKRNLLKEHPDIGKRLESRLKRWAADLKPAGLNAKMSEVWNTYFDFYLDGKPAPPRRKQTPRKRPDRRKIFQRRDTNKDGQLTLKELIGNPTQRNVKALTRQFKRLDKDGNGKLTLAEFLANQRKPK